MKHNVWKLRLCNSLKSSWFSSVWHLMKIKPKIKHKWSTRLALWASLPIIVNIWASGFSGKVLSCKMCKVKSSLAQPSDFDQWLVVLLVVIVPTEVREVVPSASKVPMWLEEQIAVEVQLFERSPWLTKILRGEIYHDIQVSVQGLLFVRGRWWPMLGMLLFAHGCCSWWQLHSIPRKGWVMPLSPTLLQL